MFPTVFSGGGSASSASDDVQPPDGDNKTTNLRKQLEDEKLLYEIVQMRAKRQETEKLHGLRGSGESSAGAGVNEGGGLSVSAGVEAVASRKRVPGVDESQEIGRKRGLDVSKGEGCKSADDDSKRTKTRAKRGTWTVESMPLLRRMNAIFKEKVVEMKLDPTKKYKCSTLENAMFHADSFKKLATDRVRSYLLQNCKDNADVKEFYDLSPSGKNIGDMLKKVRGIGQPTEWSDWLCRTCSKVECECPSQEN